jgi:hypothetical protein
MKQLTFAVTLLLLCISFSTSLAAAKVEVEGKAWLDAQKDPAEMNVNGAWSSEEWGAFLLTQTGKPRGHRQRRGIPDHRHSQRQASIHAFLNEGHCRLLRYSEF